MKVMITGGSGMLGHHLMRLARREGHEVWGSFHSHRVAIAGCHMFAMDLTDENRSKQELKAIGPDVVVHTAALTDVDQCESQPELTRRVNVDGTRLLAEAAENLDAQFVFLSTDYVFDGEKGDYREDDPPAPVNRYGESKLRAEYWVQRRSSRSLILRTTIFGRKLPPQKGLMEMLIAALRSGRTLCRFSDQHFTPLYTGQISRLILRLIERGALGLFHIGAREKTSRFEFACMVAEMFACTQAVIHPVPFRHIEGIAKRPRDSSLMSARVQERWGIEAPDLHAGLLEFKSDWEAKEKPQAND